MKISALGILLAGALLVSPTFGDELPAGGIPLARGMIWTGAGIGATSLGGISLAGREALPMARMEGCGWYHYRPWLMAAGGYDLAMASPDDEAQLFTSRYEIHSTMVWPMGRRSAFQVDWLLDGGTKSFYVDTAVGAPPVLNSSSYFGSGMLAAVGTRQDLLGLSLSAGGRWAWWTSVSGGRDLDWTWEVSPSVSFGLQRLWPRSDSLTKAWDVVLRFPIEYTARQIDLSKVHGRSYESLSWSVGVHLGLAVVL